jgi:hypothetical protein
VLLVSKVGVSGRHSDQIEQVAALVCSPNALPVSAAANLELLALTVLQRHWEQAKLIGHFLHERVELRSVVDSDALVYASVLRELALILV